MSRAPLQDLIRLTADEHAARDWERGRRWTCGCDSCQVARAAEYEPPSMSAAMMDGGVVSAMRRLAHVRAAYDAMTPIVLAFAAPHDQLTSDAERKGRHGAMVIALLTLVVDEAVRGDVTIEKVSDLLAMAVRMKPLRREGA